MRSLLALATVLMSVSTFAANDLGGTQVVCKSEFTKTLTNSSGRGDDDTHSTTQTITLKGNQDHVSGDVMLDSSYDGKLKRKFTISLDRWYNDKGEYRVLTISTVVGGIEVSTEGSDSSVNLRVGGSSADGVTCSVQ